MATGRKTGGRRKGALNKPTIARREASKSGLSAKEYLTQVLRDQNADKRERFAATLCQTHWLSPRSQQTLFWIGAGPISKLRKEVRFVFCGRVELYPIERDCLIFEAP